MYYFLTFAFLIAPFIALFLVKIAVILTSFPVYLYRKSLIKKAKRKVRDSRSIFIGITGSYGKSSVKEYMYHILSSHKEIGKTDLNMNTEVGIAISLLKNLKKDTQYFIVETGAYTKGEIQQATSYIPFQYAVLTGLGNQHLDLYGNRQNLIDEETYLLYTVPQKGKVYMNYDIPVRKEISRDITAERNFYGTNTNADIQMTILESDHTGQKAQIEYKKKKFLIRTNLIGEHTILNLLPAIAIGLDIGIPVTKITKSISQLKPIPGKLSLHKGPNKTLIINDGANSNVEGFKAAIHTLQKFPQKSKIIISQGIIELGVEKTDSYKKILNELEKTDIRLFSTDNLFKDITKSDRVVTFNDVKRLWKRLLPLLKGDTVVLIEGKFPRHIIQNLLN
jgi:UDP-N-acetylmuramoyl-tripeptide--D-alanyl-D-alanine ligase